MLRDFEAQRRRALSSNSELDWQRLTLAAMRAGVDVLNRPVPAFARWRLSPLDIAHPLGVDRMALSSCGQYLACIHRRTLYLWHYEDRHLIWRESFTDSQVTDLSFDPESQLVLVLTKKKSVEVQRLEGQELELVAEFPRPFDLLLDASHSEFFAIRIQSEVARYSLEDGRLLRRELVGIYGRQFYFDELYQRLYWIVSHKEASGDILWSRQFGQEQSRSLGRFSKIHNLLASPCGTELLILTRNQDCVALDLEGLSRRLIFRLDGTHSARLLACLDHGQRILASHHASDLLCWDREQQKKLWSMNFKEPFGFVTLPQTKTVAVGVRFQRELSFIHWPTGESQRTRYWQAGGVERVYYNGGLLACDLNSQDTQLFDSSQARISKFPGRKLLSLSSDGRQAVTQDAEFVSLFDTTDGAVLEFLPGRVQRAWHCGEAIYALSQRELYEYRQGELTIVEIDFSERVMDCEVSSDGRWLVSCCWDGQQLLWDIPAASRRWSLPFAQLPSFLSFSASGRVLWVYGRHGADMELMAMASASSQVLLRARRPDFSGVFARNPPPDLMAGVIDSDIVLWRYDGAQRSLEECARFSDSSWPIRDLVFSADGETLVSVDELGAVTFWPLGPQRAAWDGARSASFEGALD